MSTTTLPNSTSQFISLQTAIDLTTRFRNQREAMLDATYQGRDVLPLSETFHRDAIEQLLAVENCEGIRVYYGCSESNDQLHAILVPVDENNQDILSASSLQNEDDPLIVENGQRCPPSCPPPSVLNQ